MKIGDLSTTQVVSVHVNEVIDAAISLMEQHEFHHLPVLGGDGQVVGMLSDRDILTAVGWLSSAERRLPDGKLAGPRRVGEIMTKPVHFVAPGDAVRLATRLMIHERIHALPLVEHGRLVGIVTENDLLRGILAAPEFTDTVKPLLAEPITGLLSGELRTVGPRTSLDDIVETMCQDRLRHLPVVVAGELVGILSDRDVRRAIGRAMIEDEVAQETGKFYMGPTLASEIMRTDVQALDAAATIGRAADELLQHHFHSLPVVKKKHLVGIVTDTDILRAVGAADKIS